MTRHRKPPSSTSSAGQNPDPNASRPERPTVGRWDRRTFLQASLASGLALGLPVGLGCGRDSIQKVSPKTFHLELHGVDEARPAGTYYLNAPYSKHTLVAHDEVSRAAIPADHPVRRAGRHQRVTHYATEVQIPDDRLTLSTVTFAPDGGEPGHHHFVGLLLHPFSSVDALHAGESAMSPYGSEGDVTDGSGLPRCSTFTGATGPLDTAAALVFMHPEITTLDPDEAAAISCRIYNSAAVTDLAWSLYYQGRATPDGGWATLNPMKDLEGQAVSTGGGIVLQNITLSDETMGYLKPAVHEVLRTIKADATLASKRYSVTSGTGTIARSSTGDSQVTGLAADPYTLEPTHAAGSETHGVEWRDITVLDPAARKVKLRLRNHHLRWFGVYLELLDESGAPIALATLNPDALVEYSSGLGGSLDLLDGDTKKFMGLISAPPVVMGVPVQDISSLDYIVELTLPAEAVTLRVLLGSLGNGSYADEGVVVAAGIVLTVILQYALPVYTIIHAYGLDETETLWQVLKYPLLIDLVSTSVSYFSFVKALIEDKGKGEAGRRAGGATVKTLLDAASGVGLFMLDKIAPKIAAWMKEKEVEETVEEKVPIAGIVLQVATVAAAVADVAITTTQVCSNPPVCDNTIQLALKVQVTIHHDLDDFQFPATATHYEVEVLRQGGDHYTSGPISLGDTTHSDAIVRTVADIPSGGKATLQVTFTDEHGHVVGHGLAATYRLSQDTVDAVEQAHAHDPHLTQILGGLQTLVGTSYPDTPALVSALEGALGLADSDTVRKTVALSAAITPFTLLLPAQGDVFPCECTITEVPPPLTAQTTYSHKQRLLISGGERVWQGGTAPGGTHFDLSCGPETGSLCAAGDLSLIQRSGVAGYSFRAASDKLGQCGSGTVSTQLWAAQTVSLTEHPQRGFQRAQTHATPCGHAPPVLVAFDLMGAHDGTGRNLAVVPGFGADGAALWRVQQLVADGKADLELTGSGCYGLLAAAPSSVAVHPGGYLVSVSRNLHKLEVLELPEQPWPDELAVSAAIYGGHGDLPGLMDSPSVVRATLSGRIYVLEAGNRRVQVFNALGQPVALFGGGTSPFFSLAPTGEETTLLDLGVESKGYVYILGYDRDGSATEHYLLDLYKPDGTYLCRTRGVNAARMMVDLWRNVYTLNYDVLMPPDGVGEPSLSLWIPKNPA